MEIAEADLKEILEEVTDAEKGVELAIDYLEMALLSEDDKNGPIRAAIQALK